MKILSFLLMLLTIFLYNCSSSDVEKEKNEKEMVSEVEQTLDDKSSTTAKESEPFYEEKAGSEVASEEVPTSEPMEKSEVKAGDVQIGTTNEYVVEKGDTLLLVSFKLYGDYRRWRQILAENPGLSQDRLTEGQKIRYTPPQTPFEWQKRGNPHLILRGDTLGKISNKYYGSNKRWKDIFENNKPMILDPNLIFAGFTLYYIPDNLAQN